MWMAFGVIVAAAVAALVPTPAAWVEQAYSRQWYLVVQRILTPVSGVVGFSLLDVLAVVGLLGLGCWWWRDLRRTPGSARRARAVGLTRLALHTAAAAAVLYLVFLALWGLNYRRMPLTDKLDYDAARISPPALVSLASESVERLNALHAPAAAEPWPTLEAHPERFGAAFELVQRRLGASRTALAGRPKTTLLTAYFRRAGIDGMLSPFTLEVLVNGAVLPFERPFLVAHEWSHLAGYADESEASFVGVLICLAGDVQSRYSAWLFLSQQLVRHLPADARERVWAKLDDGPRADLRAIAARLREAVPVVRRGASRVYDRYLRANRVAAGIASYGLVVDLLLGTDGTPTWRGLAGSIDAPSDLPSPALRR